MEKIPAPPQNAKEAISKVATNNDYSGTKCSAEKLFQPIEQQVKTVEAEYVATAKTDSGIPGLSSEDAKKMSDPGMRKKMKGMSKEEKMKMAMEMMKSASAGGEAAEMDTPPVRAALDEWQKIYNAIPAEFKRSGAEQQEEIRLTEEYQKAHAEIDAWELAEINKLPQISSGEMSAPDPVKVKEVKLKAAEKHIALADKHLEKIRSVWGAAVERIRTKYTPFYRKLIAANYAADTKKASSRKVLSNAQMTILKEIGYRIEQSRKSWEESARWMAHRLEIGRQ